MGDTSCPLTAPTLLAITDTCRPLWGSQRMMYINMSTQLIKTVTNIVQSARLDFINLYNCDYVFRLGYCC